MGDNWNAYPADPSQASIHQQLPMLNTGSAMYYVSNQSKNPADTEEIWIQKSSDSGVTWTNVYNGPKQAPGGSYNAVLSGTKIYIVVAPRNNGQTVKVFIFDTLTDTMLTDGAVGPIAESRDIYAQTQSDNTILLGYWTYEIPGPVALAVALYDPALDSWGTPQVSSISTPTGDYSICGFVTDPDTQITYAFYGSVPGSSPDLTFRCVPVTRTGSSLAFGSDVLVAIWRHDSSLGDVQEATGRPFIVPATHEIVIPYLFLTVDVSFDPAAYNGFLYLARSPLAALSFASDLIIEYPTGPGPVNLLPIIYTMGYEAGNEGGWSIAACQVFHGALYIFWTDAAMSDPGGYPNPVPGGTANLRYVTSTGPGTYTAPQTAFTIGESGLGQPYPVLVSDDLLGIMLPRFDPTAYYNGDDGALNMFFLTLGGVVPPVPVVSDVIIQLYGWKLYPVNPCGPMAEELLPARPWWERGKK